jgi:SulP family sulfate permease
LLVLVALAPVAGFIPLSALAAVLIWVAFNMVPWRELRELRQFSMFYRVTLVTTFALTVIFDLTVAVQVGLILSCLFFIYRMSSLTRVEPIELPPERTTLYDGRRLGAWQLYGSLFFGSVTKLESLLDPAKRLPDVVIFEMHKVIYIDNTGLDSLEGLLRTLKRRRAKLILVDVNEQPLQLLERSGFLDDLGRGNVVAGMEAAFAASLAP